MNFLKNLVSNIPMVIGLGALKIALLVKKVADLLFDLSFSTHVALNTEVGQKIKVIKEQMKQHVEAMVAAQKLAGGDADSGRLAKVFNKGLPNGVIQIGKKPTTDN